LDEFKNKNSVFLGIRKNGEYFFQVSKLPEDPQSFSSGQGFRTIKSLYEKGTEQGFLTFQYRQREYFGVYKYNPRWGVFLIRGEELAEFYASSNRIFKNVSLIIIAITLISTILGMFLLKYILRFLDYITHSIMIMNQKQELKMIDLGKAPNDDITFLGMSFNALSTTISNLLNIFQKFTNKDIVQKAYEEKSIRLEGSRRELTCLFSDIKSFTNMTEVLGTDIITLLNLHYNQAIQEIIKYDGVIGSIIGDALLAVYGTLPDSPHNKSYASVVSAYAIQEVAKSLRIKMEDKKKKIEAERSSLTPEEERVFKAVWIQVGVGIDGGSVFYGNIGSYERMTNTVIGDNVNSASRLEGLTRIYEVPVICSEYVKEDIEKNVPEAGIRFVELDTVQVKGKTIGKKVFWPLPEKKIDEKMDRDLKNFSLALTYYYKGEWKKAAPLLEKVQLNPAKVFLNRTRGNTPPENWSGIWTMTTK
jgi:class 3 adenylate cyclase